MPESLPSHYVEMTDGERLLWQRIRDEQLGVKFRRQHPLGAYIAALHVLAGC